MEITLNEKAGVIPVSQKDGIFWMKQNQPQFGDRFSIDELAKVLSLPAGDFDDNFPIEEVSTGLPFTLIPIKNLAALQKAKVDLGFYEKFCSKANARPLFLFTKQSYETGQNIASRMFAPCFGISEDPATGSANGCLAAYLLRHNFFKSEKLAIKVAQGYEINRKSEIAINCQLQKNTYEIRVGGRVVLVAEGTWFIDA